tara:strand:- start:349 stop:735 length:387 start_codon:yes stop_codon:yes gene_type:complete
MSEFDLETASNSELQLRIYENILGAQFIKAGLTSSSSLAEIEKVLAENKDIRENWNLAEKLRKKVESKIVEDKPTEYDFTCCICGKGSNGFGNNPETVGALKYSLDAKCCDECNDTVVIPARLGAMFK